MKSSRVKRCCPFVVLILFRDVRCTHRFTALPTAAHPFPRGNHQANLPCNLRAVLLASQVSNPLLIQAAFPPVGRAANPSDNHPHSHHFNPLDSLRSNPRFSRLLDQASAQVRNLPPNHQRSRSANHLANPAACRPRYPRRSPQVDRPRVRPVSPACNPVISPQVDPADCPRQSPHRSRLASPRRSLLSLPWAVQPRGRRGSHWDSHQVSPSR